MDTQGDERTVRLQTAAILGQLFANRYMVEGLLGRGGVGSVYRVRAAYSVAGASFTRDLVLESPPGSTIELTYNPGNPGQSFTPDAAGRGLAWLLLGAAVFVLVVTLV